MRWASRCPSMWRPVLDVRASRLTGSGRWTPSGSMRCSSPGSARGTARSSPPRSVDVNAGQLLDVVPGRSGDKPKEWLEAKGKEWRDNVRWATLDLSGPYRRCSTKSCPTPPRWLIISCGETRQHQSSTSAAGGSRTRLWDIGATSPTPSIVAGVSSPRPTSASMRRGRRSSSGFCASMIPGAR